MNPQAEVLSKYLARRFRNRMIVVAIALVIFLIGATISQIQDNQRQAAYAKQDDATKTATTGCLTGLYGTLPIDLCSETGLVAGTGSLSASAHLLAVRVSDSSIYDPYNSVLPFQSSSILNLDGVVCIHENMDTIYRSDPYKSMNDSNAPVTHYCNYHRVDFDVTVINAKSKQKVAEKSFLGSEVDSRVGCPVLNSLDIDWSTYSDPPTAAIVADWVKSVVTFN